MKAQTFTHLHTRTKSGFSKTKVAFAAAFAYVAYSAAMWLSAIGVIG